MRFTMLLSFMLMFVFSDLSAQKKGPGLTQANDSSIVIMKDGAGKDTLTFERPQATYEEIKYKPKTSILHIPIDINVRLLEKKINENFEGLIYEDLNIEDDSLMIKAWKEKDFKISYEGNELSYTLPVKLWIKKRFGLGITYTDREIDAAINLNMKTTIGFSKTWKLITKTTIVGYEWIKKPTMKVGFFDIPITYFVDKIINGNKNTFHKTIDESIGQFIPLRNYAEDIWSTVQDPIDISTNGYTAWIKTTPKKIYTTPIVGKNGKILTTFGVQCLMEVYMGNPPVKVKKETTLSEFQMVKEIQESFKINLLADIPYLFIDSIAKGIMIGESFGEGKTKIKVEGIDIYGQNEKLVIGLKVTGFMNGLIYMTGLPYYDKESFSIRVKDVNYDLKTKNILAKTANFFYKSGLKRKIEEELIFSLKEQFYLVKEMSRSELFNMEIIENVKLDGFVQDIDVSEIFLSEQGLKAGLTLSGKMRVIVE